MARDYMNIGSTPAGEECVQVGTSDYYSKSMKEGKAFINQLTRMFGDPSEYNCSFRVKAFPHDFGTYHEVVVSYNDEDEDACQFAYKVEAEAPEYWDNEAKLELRILEVAFPTKESK